MKAPKIIYPTSEIAHLWAHQKVDYARNKQGNLYFEGDTIYSYGPHFPIARIVRHKKKTAVLLTTQSFSQMTATHIFWVRGAIDHMTVFRVDNPNRNAGVLDDYKRRLKALWPEALRCRDRRESALSHYQEVLDQANEYAKFFDLKTRLKLPPEFGEEMLKAKAIYAKAEARNLERCARLKAETEKLWRLSKEKLEKLLPLWLAGEVTTNLLPPHDLPHLRLIKSEKQIETSYGAVVPVDDAIRLWRLVLLKRTKGLEVPPIEVGGYQLNKVAIDGDVRIGCHLIRFEEMKRIAMQLGLINEETDLGPDRTAAPAAA